MADLFDGAYPDPEPVSRLQRMRAHQRETIRLGRHPLNGRELLGRETCGSCANRYLQGGHARDFPKCKLGPITQGPRTDVLASWPACSAWEPRSGRS